MRLTLRRPSSSPFQASQPTPIDCLGVALRSLDRRLFLLSYPAQRLGVVKDSIFGPPVTGFPPPFPLRVPLSCARPPECLPPPKRRDSPRRLPRARSTKRPARRSRARRRKCSSTLTGTPSKTMFRLRRARRWMRLSALPNRWTSTVSRTASPPASWPRRPPARMSR